MTTPSTERKAGPLLGTGAQTTWPFTFKVFAATDIAVTIADALGVETALVYGVDFNVTLNVNQETSPGGTVTYPIAGSPLPVGSRLVIVGNLPYDQPLDLPSGGNFSPLALENELDRLTMQIQQLRERVGRALQVSVTTGANVGLPAPSANELIGWDSTGQNLQNFALSELATAVAYATMRYDTFTGDGVETQFTLTADPVTLANLDVSISGVTQVPGTDYSLLNGVLVFTSAPANGTQILARYGEGLVNVGGDSSDIRFLQAGAGAIERTVQARLRDGVSVKDFGAVGDGVANDTAAIQAALNSNGGNVSVYFPRGVYKITSTILIPQSRATKMYGDGFNPQETTNPIEGTVIKWAGAANGLMFSSNVNGGANTSGLIIKDLRFDGDNIASRGMVIGADAAHPQHEYFENVQFRNFAFNGTDACLDLAGASYSKYGVADANFVNVLIDGGARALRVSSQQLNFYGGAIGAKNGSVLVELGDNSHPKFYGTGFYSGPGNPITVFGVAGTIGIDGLECYGCWNEGQQGLFGRLGPTFSPAVSAYRVIFHGQRSACVSSGTRVIDLTGLNCNLVWEGGYNDNTALSAVYLESGSTMTVYQLQAGGFTYTGAGTAVVTEYRSNGVKRWLGSGLTDDIEFTTNVGLKALNSAGSRPSLVRLNSDDLCVLGDDGLATLTKLVLGPSANFPAGAAKYNGVVGVDSTNGWLVFYVGGQRYKVTGTAY